MIVGWIAPVSGDIYKARCLYCHIIVRAHYKDLKGHARTAKHAHNVALSQPGCIAVPGNPATKTMMNRKRAFGPRRATRFGVYFIHTHTHTHTHRQTDRQVQAGFFTFQEVLYCKAMVTLK